MDLSTEDVSFPTLGMISLLTVDYPQNYDKSYLGQEPPCDGPERPQIRGCYVGLSKLAVHAPRSPSTSPPPVRVFKPLKFASVSEDEECTPISPPGMTLWVTPQSVQTSCLTVETRSCLLPGGQFPSRY